MNKFYITALLAFAGATPAFAAAAPVPAPVAGAFGPAGLAVAAAAYVGYRVWKRRSDD